MDPQADWQLKFTPDLEVRPTPTPTTLFSPRDLQPSLQILDLIPMIPLQILDLIPQADQVTKLGAECSYCRAAGHPRAAHFTLRIAADSRQEVVGGADKYAPVCRQHYNELSGIREMTAAASV